MTGSDLLILRRDLDLTQEEARLVAGIANRGSLVDIERDRVKLAPEEYDRIAAAYRAHAEKTRKGVMA